MHGQLVSIEEVIETLRQAQSNYKNTVIIERRRFKMTKKLKTFATHGIKCDVCGLKGDYFEIKKIEEKGNSSFDYYLNLVAITPTGEERFLTADHSTPACIGGVGNQDNLRPLCNKCNNEWKSRIDQNLRRSIIGFSKDKKHYLQIVQE